MATWFTSDTHFGHSRIIELCNRPFNSVIEMNERLVRNWNELVGPEDTVYHLGDVALGPIDQSLGYISRLMGRKILILGNHDRPFMAKTPEKEALWTERYIEAGFDSVWDEHIMLGDFGRLVHLSHFPYDGDTHNSDRPDRYVEARIRDSGRPLIHGHTHSTGSPVSRSKAGSLQIHVGVDAWGFRPVHSEEVAEIIRQEAA